MSEARAMFFVRLAGDPYANELRAYLRDALRRPAECGPCLESGVHVVADWYSDIGTGKEICLLCPQHKREVEVTARAADIPIFEESPLYLFEAQGVFLR